MCDRNYLPKFTHHSLLKITYLNQVQKFGDFSLFFFFFSQMIEISKILIASILFFLNFEIFFLTKNWPLKKRDSLASPQQVLQRVRMNQYSPPIHHARWIVWGRKHFYIPFPSTQLTIVLTIHMHLHTQHLTSVLPTYIVTTYITYLLMPLFHLHRQVARQCEVEVGWF